VVQVDLGGGADGAQRHGWPVVVEVAQGVGDLCGGDVAAVYGSRYANFRPATGPGGTGDAAGTRDSRHAVEPDKDEAEAQGGTPNGEEPYQMDPI